MTAVESAAVDALSRPVESTSSTGAVEPDHVRIERWASMLGLSGKAVLTTVETAHVLRISERLVRDGIKVGTIPSVRLGRRVLVPVPMLLESLLRVPRTGESKGR